MQPTALSFSSSYVNSFSGMHTTNLKNSQYELTDFGGSFMYGVDKVRPCESV